MFVLGSPGLSTWDSPSLYLMGLAFPGLGPAYGTGMGEFVDLQCAFGTKQGKTSPRATWPCGSPELSCSPAVIGSIWAARTSWSRLGFGKQVKGFEWEKISSLLGRSSVSGKAGVARWSLEEGTGIFHFHWLLLQTWDCEARVGTADTTLVLARSLL